LPACIGYHAAPQITCLKPIETEELAEKIKLAFKEK